jgi:hypothetical protein
MRENDVTSSHLPWVSSPVHIQPHAHELCRGALKRALDDMSTVTGAPTRPHSVSRCLWHSIHERQSECERTVVHD